MHIIPTLLAALGLSRHAFAKAASTNASATLSAGTELCSLLVFGSALETFPLTRVHP